MDEWLTIAEVEKKTGIPERTIRRYINQHGSHLPTRRQHRSYLLAPDILPTLAQIRDYYAAGWSSENVEEALAKTGVPMTITVAGDDGRVAVTVADALTDLRRAVAEALTSVAGEQRRVAQQLEALRQELAATRETQERIERSIEERDRKLTEALRALTEKEKRRGWWKKIFSMVIHK